MIKIVKISHPLFGGPTIPVSLDDDFNGTKCLIDFVIQQIRGRFASGGFVNLVKKIDTINWHIHGNNNHEGNVYYDDLKKSSDNVIWICGHEHPPLKPKDGN